MNAPNEQSARPSRASWIGLLAAIGLCLLIVLRVLAPFASVLLLALVAAGLIHPPYLRLVRRLGGHPRLAAFIVCLLLLVVVLVPLYIVALDVSGEALAFYEMSTTELTERGVLERLQQNRDRIERVNAFLEPFGVFITAEDVSDWLTTGGVRLGAFFYKQGVSVATGLLQFVFGFIFWVLVLFYLLLDGEAVRSWFRDTVPIPPDEQQQLSARFMEMASSLVVGNGLAGLIQGVAGGVVFAAAGLPGPVLWGAVMGILAFIPVIGISLVFIPAFLILLIAGETTKAFVVFVPLVVIATVVEYWLKPMLVGRRGQMHTLLVFLALIGGLSAYGATGILIGPLMMTAFLTLVEIYRERYRPWLDTASTDTDPTPDRDSSDSND
ncbi:MAG: AI-2E family transporter [Thermoanaerobaculales bacterium]|jgi:predicted PurR-regulated permease PerM|nr:AI-2E family transporter [Thermoanaerobaculales bacterium]